MLFAPKELIEKGIEEEVTEEEVTKAALEAIDVESDQLDFVGVKSALEFLNRKPLDVWLYGIGGNERNKKTKHEFGVIDDTKQVHVTSKDLELFIKAIENRLNPDQSNTEEEIKPNIESLQYLIHKIRRAKLSEDYENVVNNVFVELFKQT